MSLASWREIVRPSPTEAGLDPDCRIRSYGSKIYSQRALGTPAPLSRIEMTASPSS